jgi:hypothetical protein
MYNNDHFSESRHHSLLLLFVSNTGLLMRCHRAIAMMKDDGGQRNKAIPYLVPINVMCTHDRLLDSIGSTNGTGITRNSVDCSDGGERGGSAFLASR